MVPVQPQGATPTLPSVLGEPEPIADPSLLQMLGDFAVPLESLAGSHKSGPELDFSAEISASSASAINGAGGGRRERDGAVIAFGAPLPPG